MDKQFRIRPHNDDPKLVVIEARTYSGNSEDLGEELDSDVVTRPEMLMALIRMINAGGKA